MESTEKGSPVDTAATHPPANGESACFNSVADYNLIICAT